MERINAKTLVRHPVNEQVNGPGINPLRSQGGTGDLDNLIGSNSDFLNRDRNGGGLEDSNTRETEDSDPDFPRD
jgi:hypothetical protein